MPAIVDKRALALGVALAGGFAAVLAWLLAPVHEGKTGLVWADELFNGLAKGSAWHVGDLREEARRFEGQRFQAAMVVKAGTQAAEALLRSAGADVRADGEAVKASGDLGRVALAVLTDAEDMYFNRGRQVSARHDGLGERQVLYAWWTILEQMDKGFRAEGLRQADELCQHVMTKAVEPAYNFYGVQPRKVRDQPVKVGLLLALYVLYTVWLGGAVYFTFKGLGLRAGTKVGPSPAQAPDPPTARG